MEKVQWKPIRFRSASTNAFRDFSGKQPKGATHSDVLIALLKLAEQHPAEWHKTLSATESHNE